MEEKYLKKLHKSELKILDEIVRICEKNDLNYFLIGGTLLGAVRHKGFIPWDDDLDIAMPREDYEKFLSIAKNELSDDFELDDISTNDKYWLIFAKVRLKNSTFLAGFCSKKFLKHNGIWVDIFPFDESRHNKDIFIRMKWYYLKLLIATYSRKNEMIIMKKHFLTDIYNIIYKKCSFKNFNKKIKRLITAENGKTSSSYFINYGSQYGVLKQTHLKSNIFPLKKLEFEGKEYSVPNNYKQVLTSIYGESFMQLPPVEKRITHDPYYILFEDGEEVKFDEKV